MCEFLSRDTSNCPISQVNSLCHSILVLILSTSHISIHCIVFIVRPPGSSHLSLYLMHDVICLLCN